MDTLTLLLALKEQRPQLSVLLQLNTHHASHRLLSIVTSDRLDRPRTQGNDPGIAGDREGGRSDMALLPNRGKSPHRLTFRINLSNDAKPSRQPDSAQESPPGGHHIPALVLQHPTLDATAQH
jgi:hypothetical protein